MYIPNNMIFVAVGDFNGAEAMAKITKAFADFEPRRIPPNPMPVEPEQLGKRYAEKEMNVKITDRKRKSGLMAKTGVLVGYPAVIFCTALLTVDEQEATRFILLSPETTQEKLRQGVKEAISKGTNRDAYLQRLNANTMRQLLMQRIAAIKEERILSIIVPNPHELEQRFFRRHSFLKPRNQRDVERLLSLAKSLALLNLWHRDTTENLRVIIASKEDIETAFRIYDEISPSQELGLPPYILQIHTEVISPLCEKQAGGVSRREILKEHYSVYQRPLARWVLDKQIIPMLETAGLVVQERDPEDRRRMLVVAVDHKPDPSGGVPK
jgi:hypothetical protein